MISSGRICCGDAIKPTADIGPWALVWGLMLVCRINPARHGLVEMRECLLSVGWATLRAGGRPAQGRPAARAPSAGLTVPTLGSTRVEKGLRPV